MYLGVKCLITEEYRHVKSLVKTGLSGRALLTTVTDHRAMMCTLFSELIIHPTAVPHPQLQYLPMSHQTQSGTRPAKPFSPTVGKVYRTEDLSRWTSNPSRLVSRLVKAGELVRVAKGMYVKPERNRFGVMPATAAELIGALVKHTPFIFSGPTYWNALGVGSTAMFPVQLVYNTKRSGDYVLGGRRFRLSRQRFPSAPTPEWFAVDLIAHRDEVGLDDETLMRGLTHAITEGTLSATGLEAMATEYGTRPTQQLVAQARRTAAAPIP